MRSGRYEPGDVRHVDHQVGTDRIGDLAEPLEVECARVSARAGDDHLGTGLLGDPGDLVVVDHLSLGVQPVGHDVVEFAREVHG